MRDTTTTTSNVDCCRQSVSNLTGIDDLDALLARMTVRGSARLCYP